MLHVRQNLIGTSRCTASLTGGFMRAHAFGGGTDKALSAVADGSSDGCRLRG
jgi:hypothetical protein